MLPLIKICDFGYSKSRDMSMPKSKVGTLACEFTQGTINFIQDKSRIWWDILSNWK